MEPRVKLVFNPMFQFIGNCAQPGFIIWPFIYLVQIQILHLYDFINQKFVKHISPLTLLDALPFIFILTSSLLSVSWTNDWFFLIFNWINQAIVVAYIHIHVIKNFAISYPKKF